MPAARTINEVRGLPPGRDYLISKFKFSNRDTSNFAQWVVDEIFAGQGYFVPTIDVSTMNSGIVVLDFGSEIPNQLPYICNYLTPSGLPNDKVGPFAFYSGLNSWSGHSATISAATDGYYVWNFNEEESYIDCEEQGGQWRFDMQNADMISDGVGQSEIEIRFYRKLALDIQLSL
mgnify:CR=1 FL=1